MFIFGQVFIGRGTTEQQYLLRPATHFVEFVNFGKIKMFLITIIFALVVSNTLGVQVEVTIKPSSTQSCPEHVVSDDKLIIDYVSVFHTDKTKKILSAAILPVSSSFGNDGIHINKNYDSHNDGKSCSRISTPLGCHRMRVHNGVDYEVETTILEHETEISARKTLEAFWIHAKNPKMNRKEECPTITNELLPYLRLCNI
ncbi:hypothetical protein Y032_0041g480 [Ancylostoma ceylanicum]|nr:hypothetical protein Y032_0041g480 [Ancylostoma ceylanicum]